MDRKSLGIVGVLLALSTASRTLNPASPHPTQESAAQVAQSNAGLLGQAAAAGTAACPQSDDGPWNAACNYFALAMPEGWKTANFATLKARRWSCVPHDAKIEFLIATVPDPQTTHLALYFDRTVESLAWALGDAGYVFRNSWLPWTAPPEKGLSGLSDRDCQRVRTERRRDLPGLLVFERPDKALLVFLVGESPTSGVHKTALANTVQYIHAIRPGEQDLRVVGPFFSGSFSPLATDILALPPDISNLRFRFVTGAATNYDAFSKFQARLAGKATLESVIENDERASRLFIQYLGWQCLRQPRIAILSENDTVYGNLMRTESGDKEADSHRRLALTYPREIARLRNAYQEEGALSSAGGKSEARASEGVQHTLKDVPDTDDVSERDTIPAFSPRQSPASQQAALSGITANLRRDRVDFTGIIATDILDNLFLTRFLRTNSPDVRVFTLDADLLFPWEEENDPFQGILSVTTYPLVARNQHWTGAELPSHIPRRMQFVSRAAEGTYNACSRLIYRESCDESLLEYCRPIPPAGTEPPLWLTAVGRDGYWPVALLDKDGNQAPPSSLLHSMNSPEIEPQLHPEYPSRAWYLCFWVAVLFCWLHCLYLWRLLHPPEKTQPETEQPKQARESRWRAWVRKIATAFWDRLQTLSSVFKAYPESALEDREKPFLLVATLSAACVVVVLTSSLARFLFVPHPHGWTTALVSTLFYSAVGGATVIALFVTAWRLRSEWYLPLVIPSCALAIAFCLAWMFLNIDSRYLSGLFFAYRNLSLGNGVSPAVPVLLLSIAYYGWSWVHLKREGEIVARTRFTEQRKKEPSLANLHELVTAVDEALENILSDRILVPAVLFIALWFLLFTPFLSLRSLEHWPYDVLYGALETVIYWSMAVSWVQLMLVWSRLKGFLQWLERQPIRNAFSRLRKDVSWVPLVTNPTKNLFISTRAYDCLTAIMEFDETGLTARRVSGLRKLKSDQAQNATRIRQNIEALDGNLSAGGVVDRDIYTNLQIGFEIAAQSITDDLKSSVWQLGDSDSLRQEIESQALRKPLWDEDRLTILEEEFVALRHFMFLRYVVRQLRNLLGFIIGGFILSVISFSAYPFQGHRMLSFGALIAFLALGVGVGIVFAEMDRDAIMSRLTDTKANEVGRTFFFRLLQYGSLPLLTVLSSQFSWVNHTLFSWLRPVLEALH